MENLWLQSALWIGLALLSSLISIRLAISVALIEIIVGAVAGNIVRFDLLVIGVMGSTCQSLVRLAPCSVVIVK
ncbi:MAG: hypothetical protein NTX06_09010 [Proteobacteria bacterium]|jgi:hypothetical protein|nr:hypothetical protein [Pseudomonadota bacterium]